MLYLIQNIIIEMGPISVTTKLIDILRTGIVGILHTLHSLVYLKHVVQQADLFNLIIFIYKHLCLLFSISQDVEMVLWQCDSFNCIYDTQVFFFKVILFMLSVFILQAHAASAILNFSENCTPDILTPYLDGIVSKLLVLLQVC